MREIENEFKSHLALEGYTVSRLEVSMGLGTNTLRNSLYRSSVPYKLAKKVADYLGYDIVWIKREK